MNRTTKVKLQGPNTDLTGQGTEARYTITGIFGLITLTVEGPRAHRTVRAGDSITETEANSLVYDHEVEVKP